MIAQQISELLAGIVANIDWVETVRSIVTAICGGVGAFVLGRRRNGRVLETRLVQERVKQTDVTARALEVQDRRMDDICERLAGLESISRFIKGPEDHGRIEAAALSRRIRELERTIIELRPSSRGSGDDAKDRPDPAAAPG